MEFELWLFAVKQLAQSYEMSQVIFSQLSDEAKDDLRKEYDATIGGGSSSASEPAKEEKKGTSSTDDKVLKEYRDLINGFHNAMSIAERYVEKNNIKNLIKSYPIDSTNPDQEFLRRLFLHMETSTVNVVKYLSYLAKDITTEGALSKGDDDIFYVKNAPLSEGMIVEFFHMNRWEIGRFCKGPGTVYGCFFLGFHNEVYDVDPEGLHVRLRG